MPFMLLIHEPVGQRQARTLAEGQAVYDCMLQFAAGLKSQGVLQAVESLPRRIVRQPASRSAMGAPRCWTDPSPKPRRWSASLAANARERELLTERANQLGAGT